ncbi:flagellin N-terminal helical domain-containing protein [Diplocloster agilis]|uniref:Flagellin n=1 Tax=Diplocloster agilis TaxID=2850323 RepID=A0A949NCZ4_9FIRM|nr:flagellin [Diplocloster agilis]MBU9739277.1 flagellin [Diplocloster agilis]MBU9744660.1 flagellin [Diplocloster agilis]
MRIQHNIMALNSNRQLGINNSAVSKSLEKLSSGYKINRAGDDAAGLAISEKMRAQIKGLTAATDNAQDAISLVQTAEGGLQEVHSMLNRMQELATKSANGTYKDDVDRKALQDEISALKDEIDRIADTTNFNKINLLDGTLDNGKTTTFTFNAKDFTATMGSGYTGKVSLEAKNANAAGTIGVTVAADGTAVDIVLGTAAAHTYTTADIEKAVRSAAQSLLDGGSVSAANRDKIESLLSFRLEADTASMDLTAADVTKVESGAVGASTKGTGDLLLQIGDTSEASNVLQLNIADMHVDALGLDGIDIGTLKGAQDAIGKITDSINKVSTTRGKLGAIQNRLEHTINNLGVTTENITAAESRIRDVDMAKEMMEFTKNSVLMQSAQAMLAQANQQPQSILQLLQ